ncbi:MAG: hypothetical protein EP329_18395 [Deltaproteobacteria bacterium]|nr:MAG: hypothetical protein EP329_18395 [Deltaproteobacteria bacterium]
MSLEGIAPPERLAGPAFYFMSPHVAPRHLAEHDLLIQHIRLKNTLRVMGGEAPLTHLSEILADR